MLVPSSLPLSLSFVLLLSLSLSLSAAPSPSPTPTPRGVYRVNPATYRADSGLIYWTILPDNPIDTRTILYDITAKTTGWAGIGFGSTHQMANTDFIVWSPNSQVSGPKMMDQNQLAEDDEGIEDDGEDTPKSDAFQNFVFVNMSVVDGWTHVLFYRDVETGDTAGDITINQTNYILWAIGDGNLGEDYDKHTHWGAAQWLDKEKGVFITVNNARNILGVHAIMMFIAWGVLVYIGIGFAKLKFLGPTWFYAHVGIQILSLMFNVTGFILALIRVSDNFETHFVFTHSQIGIVVFSLSMIQPIIGLVAHLMYNPDREGIPIIDRIHQLLGYAIVCLSAACIFVGLSEYGAADRLYVIVGVWVGLSLVITTILFIIEKVKINAFNQQTEKDADGGAKNLLIFLVGFEVLGGLISIGVFSAYLWKGNDTNVLTIYN